VTQCDAKKLEFFMHKWECILNALLIKLFPKQVHLAFYNTKISAHTLSLHINK